jgi:uncharacterized membrane protein
VLPPSVLGAAAIAELLYVAMRDRLPVTWESRLEGSELLGVIIGHDSHAANGRLVYAIVRKSDGAIVLLSGRCTMHHLQICIKDFVCLCVCCFIIMICVLLLICVVLVLCIVFVCVFCCVFGFGDFAGYLPLIFNQYSQPSILYLQASLLGETCGRI